MIFLSFLTKREMDLQWHLNSSLSLSTVTIFSISISETQIFRSCLLRSVIFNRYAQFLQNLWISVSKILVLTPHRLTSHCECTTLTVWIFSVHCFNSTAHRRTLFQVLRASKWNIIKRGVKKKKNDIYISGFFQ